MEWSGTASGERGYLTSSPGPAAIPKMVCDPLTNPMHLIYLACFPTPPDINKLPERFH